MIRLTKNNIYKILNKNNGYTVLAHYNLQKKEREVVYIIEEGELRCHPIDKVYEYEVCDIEQTRGFIKKHYEELNVEI